MTDGPYHSIGEVLSLLKEEHEDLTISKIRFLESQGLIEPERTPSGYRRFYDTDIDRLRWILSQQRDNFMPLKVIKRHLDTEGFDPAAEIGERPMAELLPEPSLFSEREMSRSLEAAETKRRDERAAHERTQSRLERVQRDVIEPPGARTADAPYADVPDRTNVSAYLSPVPSVF